MDTALDFAEIQNNSCIQLLKLQNILWTWNLLKKKKKKKKKKEIILVKEFLFNRNKHVSRRDMNWQWN